MFKKIIFPFSSEKYKFLERKWWHRLIKVIFLGFLLLIAVFLFVIRNEIVKENSFNISSKENLKTFSANSESKDQVNLIPSFFQKREKVGCIKGNKIKEIREFELDKSFCNKDIENNSDAITTYIQKRIPEYWDITHNNLKELIIKKYNEFLLRDWEKPYCFIETSLDCDKIIAYQKNILFYIQAIFYIAIIIYILSILWQLAYYKWIIYIVYGSDKKW